MGSATEHDDVNDYARLWHPWLRIERLVRLAVGAQIVQEPNDARGSHAPRVARSASGGRARGGSINSSRELEGFWYHMSDDGWIPRGFDATPILMAHWKKQRDAYYAIAGSSFQARVILPPYIEIFGAAKRLLDGGEFAAAVVVAQTSCEVLGENVLLRLMRKRGVELLSEWASRARRRSASFDNDLVRRLYVTLSNDEIQKAPFWARYAAHVELRNKIVHEGRAVTKSEAEESYQAAMDFIRHIEQMIVAQRL